MVVAKSAGTLRFAPARGEDAPVIFGFAKELMERYESDPEIDLGMALSWTRRKIEGRLGEYTRVTQNGETVAFYRFAPEGEEMELDDLYVLPAFRGRGIGTAIVKRCCGLTDKPLFLYVFEQNERAVALYRRLGFLVRERVSPTRLILARPGAPKGA